MGHFLCQWWIINWCEGVIGYALYYGYSRQVGHVMLEYKMKLKKGFDSHFKSNGITTLNKNGDAYHGLSVKRIEEEVKNNLKSSL